MSVSSGMACWGFQVVLYLKSYQFAGDHGQTLDTSSNALYNMYILYNKGVYVWIACLAPLRRERTFQN